GEREVPSRSIGEIVMEELRQLDEVAYVRYASVYHRFHDVDSFREEVERLGKRRRSDAAAGQMSLLPGARPAQQAMIADPARDAGHMARALELARRGLWTTDPNPRVGCVIADDERVVAEGWHELAGGPHAEAMALAAAGTAARGATAYVTLEPCSHHGRTPP